MCAMQHLSGRRATRSLLLLRRQKTDESGYGQLCISMCHQTLRLVMLYFSYSEQTSGLTSSSSAAVLHRTDLQHRPAVTVSLNCMFCCKLLQTWSLQLNCIPQRASKPWLKIIHNHSQTLIQLFFFNFSSLGSG